MQRRHPVPTIWLMTDERMGDALWEAVARLPRGAGVVFRHYRLADGERRAMWRRLRGIAVRRGVILVWAGAAPVGRGAAGVHNGGIGGGLRTRSVHRRRDLVAAQRAGADAVFASPVFATRSHADARPLGPVRLGLMIRGARVPVIALGGMTAQRAAALRPLGIHGWAAIDAWTVDGKAGQKRKAVPT